MKLIPSSKIARIRLEFWMGIIRTIAAAIGTIVNVYIFWKVFIHK